MNDHNDDRLHPETILDRDTNVPRNTVDEKGNSTTASHMLEGQLGQDAAPVSAPRYVRAGLAAAIPVICFPRALAAMLTPLYPTWAVRPAH